MNFPEELRYTDDHEWVRKEDDHYVVGITDFAQGELGDIVFVEIDTIGEELDKEAVFGTIEAVKTVSDLFMPMSGEVLEYNEKLDEDNEPELINKDPYGEGWIVKIKGTDEAQWEELLTAEQYREKVSGAEEA